MDKDQIDSNEEMKGSDDKSLEIIRNETISIIQTCYDPEIPVNIWELGLVYEVNVKEDKHVEVIMSLTSPFCPAAQSLPEEVKTKIEGIEGVKDVNVEITFEPAWTTDMMSEEAKLELGFM